MIRHEILKKINNLEKKYDISNLKYDDFNPWPYIRFILIQKYLSQNLSRQNKVIEKKNYIKKLYIFFNSIFNYIKNPITKKNVDVIFFTRTSELEKNLNNKLFNKFSDSLICLVKDKLKIKVLETNDLNFLKNYKYFNDKTVSIDWIKDLSIVKSRLLTLFKFPKKKTNIDCLSKEIDIVNLEKQLIILNEFSKKIEIILKKLNPKIICLVCFNSTNSMAISLACHRLKIRVIEFQHGFLDEKDVMYTNWENLSNKGYELLPDIFWMWSEQFQKKINRWAEKTFKHKAIVGGNIWLSYNKKQELNKKKQVFEKKNILIILQEDFLPEFFMSFLKKNQNNFNWYIRSHPRVTPINLKKIFEPFAAERIDVTSDRNIFEIFSFIDLSITLWSTLGYEGQCFNIPTIFLNEIAKKGYESSFGKNGLYYAESEIDLDKYLANFNETSKIDKSFIEVDRGDIQKHINKIFF